MVSLKTRLKLAISAFFLQPVEPIEIERLQIRGTLRPGAECDNIRRKSNCKNNGVYYMNNVTIEIKIESGRSYHVCPPCAKEAEETNKTQDWE